MKALFLSLLAALALSTPAQASGDGPAWDKFPSERSSQLPALQNGAKLFVEYCVGCHSAAYMRYNRLRDIGLTEAQIKDNLVLTGVKIGDTIKSSLDAKDAKDWFGAVPPDLTLIARSRSDPARGTGADYLYTYLRSYYRDEAKATGWNNTAFPDVGMPHVLWELQGPQRAVFAQEKDTHDPARTVQVFKGFEPIADGKLATADYDATVADLVAFLDWMAEPMKSSRERLGVWVLLFLAVFTAIAWRLNALYWKDIK